MHNKYILAFNKLKRNNPAFLAAVIVKQAKKLDAAKEFLTKIEWKYDSDYDADKCPSCGAMYKFGHQEYCGLKALLNQLK